MFWSRTATRERKAVLSALSAVGETGMTLLALGVAVSIPESKLQLILENLVRAGRVRLRVDTTPTTHIRRTTHYQRCAHYQLVMGRHSAAAAPAVLIRRSDGTRN